MVLIYYAPHRLYEDETVKGTVDPQHVAFSQMFNPSISLVDRSGTIGCPPVPILVTDPLPKTWNPPGRFSEICHGRYDDLLKIALGSGRKLVIFYSGGIDSTLIAALAIAHPGWKEHKEQVYLAFSNDSIRENPDFWNNTLCKEFSGRLLNSTSYHLLISDPKNLCITGEFADNIFGSLTLKSYMDSTGDDQAIHKDFRTTGLEWMIGKVKQKHLRHGCAEMLISLLETSPRALESNHDCFWWLNFVLKWQAVKYRLASHAPAASMVGLMIENAVHFFETMDFQNWAVMTDETKVENSWFSYKLPAKKMIFEINRDADYLRNKTKYPSIPGLTRYGNAWSFIYREDAGYLATKSFIR